MIRLHPPSFVILVTSAISLIPLTCAVGLTEETTIPAGVNPTTTINLLIETGWQRRGVTASPRCDDRTFLRRVYLDLIGRIPTFDEAETFLRSTESNKRDRLIDDLLDSPEYAGHMADVFDVVLMGRKKPSAIQQRQKHGWRDYLEASFHSNRPWNQMAREMVLARATRQTDVRAGWFLYERRNQHQEISEAIAPSFFGIRIECAQCHDHPLAHEIEQRHYWGLVAFFNRGKNQQLKSGPRVVESATGGFDKYTDLFGDSHEMQLTFFDSKTVDEPRSSDDQPDVDEKYVLVAEGSGEPRVPRFSRRQRFADDILSTHPMLAKAFVNRVWALFLGRGIVHPVDRMDSMHDPSHPGLLEWLAEDFRQSGFDVKRLIRHLLRADCYQLDSRPSDDLARPESFAYALDKPLTAESYLRSIQVFVSGQPSEPDPELMDKFRRTFPDVMPETPSFTLAQSLLLTNDPELHRLLDSAGESFDRWLTTTDVGKRVDSVFETGLGRLPDTDEKTQAVEYLAQRNGNPRQALSHLVWALLTSAEFRMNH